MPARQLPNLTPLTAAAYDRLWARTRDTLRASGVAAPDQLTSDTGDLIAHWRAPDLLLSQTCGLPYRAALKEDVTLVGTFDFDLPGCPPGYYNSVVITSDASEPERLEALAGQPFAYNDPLSQSGWAALALLQPSLLTGPKLCTGSHRASAQAVRTGQAKFATIDAQTWRQLEALGETDGLSVIHRTDPVAGLPLVTGQTDLFPTLQEAVRAAIAGMSPEDAIVLGIRGLVVLPAEVYALPLPPAPETLTG